MSTIVALQGHGAISVKRTATPSGQYRPKTIIEDDDVFSFSYNSGGASISVEGESGERFMVEIDRKLIMRMADSIRKAELDNEA